MQRLRLYDIRMSRFPRVLGLCQADIPRIAEAVNTAERRLLYAKEAGDDGWWGTWAEIAFTLTQATPYWTAPRNIARIAAATACDEPIDVNGQLFEYLQFGNGRLPKRFMTCEYNALGIYTRNVVPTWYSLSNPPKTLRVYPDDTADLGKRILIDGTDANGKQIYTQDVLYQVKGEYILMNQPFIDSVNMFSTITAIQKDFTVGEVGVYQVDPVTGDESLLVTMRPDETTASYRRYYFDSLPRDCCNGRAATPGVSIKAIVKLDPVPVAVDTDYTLLQNLEALIEEGQSMRYSEMDDTNAKQMSRERHQAAISMLIGEAGHYLGIDKPSIVFAPFGSARLAKKSIGTLV